MIKYKGFFNTENMARPKKDNADYHSHDKEMRNDIRIKAVRSKFGHLGYSIWNMLLEHLTGCDFFMYEYTPLNLELLSGDFDIDSKKLNEIMDYFILIELIQLEDGKILSKTHIKRFEGLLSKRKRNQKGVMDVRNPQSKVKESKVNKINTTKAEEISNSRFVEEVLKDRQWMEVTCMQTKQDFEQTRNNLINFNKHCVQHNYQKESVKDYKIHFSRWIKSQKLTRKIKVENPYGEQVTIKK